MNTSLKLLIIALVLLVGIGYANFMHAQTEGFNVKSPTEKIADSTTSFLNEVMQNAKKNPSKSIPRDLVCSAECFLVIPNIEVVESRGDFRGTGLLACRSDSLTNFTEPIYYDINNIKSFEQGGGGLIILLEDEDVVRTLLGAEMHLTSENTSVGPIGKEANTEIKSIIAYVKYGGQVLAGTDLSGSILEYASRDTFNAYQGTIVPIEILLNPRDVPPILRGFDSLINVWTRDCK